MSDNDLILVDDIPVAFSVMNLGVESASIFVLSEARQRNIVILCQAE